MPTPASDNQIQGDFDTLKLQQQRFNTAETDLATAQANLTAKQAAYDTAKANLNTAVDTMATDVNSRHIA